MRDGESTLRRLLEPLEAVGLNEADTTEVAINRPGEVWVEARGRFTRHEHDDLDLDRLGDIAILAAAMTSQDVSPSKPLCATVLPDGQRMQICRHPAVDRGLISFTIRRQAAFRPTLSALAQAGLFREFTRRGNERDELGALYDSGDMERFLTEVVRRRRNILIAGRTGSGKTTLASSLVRAIAPDERIVTIEDTPELVVPHENRVGLFYSKGDQGTAKVRADDLLEASLRLRPDRVLMGELRDGSAYTYLRAVIAGHPGSVTTCHADSAEGAFDALRTMIRNHPAGATMPDAEVEALLRQQIHVVVYCEREGARFGVTEVLFPGRERQDARRAVH